MCFYEANSAKRIESKRAFHTPQKYSERGKKLFIFGFDINKIHHIQRNRYIERLSEDNQSTKFLFENIVR